MTAEREKALTGIFRRGERAIFEGRLKARSLRLPLLQAEIGFLRERLDFLVDETNASQKKVFEKATKLLDQAALILKPERSGTDEFSGRLNSNILSALRLIQEVRRVEIELMSEENLNLRAQQLRFEIKERLRGWHRDAALGLLDRMDSDNAISLRGCLSQIVAIRNDFEADSYANKGITTQHLKIVVRVTAAFLILLSVVVLLIFYADAPLFRADEPVARLTLKGALIPMACTFAGGIGSCLSGLLTMTSADYRPDLRVSRLVTFARPIIGLCSGLIAYFFVLSGIIPIEGGPISAIPVAVAFGFSERLFLRSVEKVDTQPSSEP